MQKRIDRSVRKVFMCDCSCDGIVVAQESEPYEDCADGPFVELAFFERGFPTGSKWTWRERLRVIWRIIRKGNVFNDMVILERSTARNLAHHLLYLTSKKKLVEPEPLVKDELPQG